MAELDIKRLVLMDTLNLVVDFGLSADPNVTGYTVEATDGVHIVEKTGVTETPVRLGRVKPGKTYTVTVSAVTDESTTVGAPSDIDTTLTTTNARIVRQQIANIIESAGIAIEGQVLRVYTDRYGRPKAISENDSVVKTPGVVVEYPITRMSVPASVTRHVETLEIDLTLFDTAGEEDAGFARLDMLFARVRQAINATKNMGLAWLGVIDQSWVWTSGEPDSEKDLVAQTVTLRVDLPQVTVGVLPYVS